VRRRSPETSKQRTRVGITWLASRLFVLFDVYADEEFNVLGEDKLALLTRRFERLHENRVNMRRNTWTCFQCSKPGHFIIDCRRRSGTRMATSTSEGQMASTGRGVTTRASTRTSTSVGAEYGPDTNQ
jgi:hypothetical protein